LDHNNDISCSKEITLLNKKLLEQNNKVTEVKILWFIGHQQVKLWVFFCETSKVKYKGIL